MAYINVQHNTFREYQSTAVPTTQKTLKQNLIWTDNIYTAHTCTRARTHTHTHTHTQSHKE